MHARLTLRVSKGLAFLVAVLIAADVPISAIGDVVVGPPQCVPTVTAASSEHITIHDCGDAAVNVVVQQPNVTLVVVNTVVFVEASGADGFHVSLYDISIVNGSVPLVSISNSNNVVVLMQNISAVFAQGISLLSLSAPMVHITLVLRQVHTTVTQASTIQTGGGIDNVTFEMIGCVMSQTLSSSVNCMLVSIPRFTTGWESLRLAVSNSRFDIHCGALPGIAGIPPAFGGFILVWRQTLTVSLPITMKLLWIIVNATTFVVTFDRPITTQPYRTMVFAVLADGDHPEKAVLVGEAHRVEFHNITASIEGSDSCSLCNIGGFHMLPATSTTTPPSLHLILAANSTVSSSLVGPLRTIIVRNTMVFRLDQSNLLNTTVVVEDSNIVLAAPTSSNETVADAMTSLNVCIIQLGNVMNSTLRISRVVASFYVWGGAFASLSFTLLMGGIVASTNGAAILDDVNIVVDASTFSFLVTVTQSPSSFTFAAYVCGGCVQLAVNVSNAIIVLTNNVVVDRSVAINGLQGASIASAALTMLSSVNGVQVFGSIIGKLPANTVQNKGNTSMYGSRIVVDGSSFVGPSSSGRSTLLQYSGTLMNSLVEGCDMSVRGLSLRSPIGQPPPSPTSHLWVLAWVGATTVLQSRISIRSCNTTNGGLSMHYLVNGSCYSLPAGIASQTFSSTEFLVVHTRVDYSPPVSSSPSTSACTVGSRSYFGAAVTPDSTVALRFMSTTWSIYDSILSGTQSVFSRNASMWLADSTDVASLDLYNNNTVEASCIRWTDRLLQASDVGVPRGMLEPMSSLYIASVDGATIVPGCRGELFTSTATMIPIQCAVGATLQQVQRSPSGMQVQLRIALSPSYADTTIASTQFLWQGNDATSITVSSHKVAQGSSDEWDVVVTSTSAAAFHASAGQSRTRAIRVRRNLFYKNQSCEQTVSFPLASEVLPGLFTTRVAVVVAGLGLSVFQGWGSGVLIQRSLAAIAIAACADSIDQAPQLSDSPLQLQLGAAAGGGYVRGTIVGNAVVLGAVCAFLLGGGMWLRRRERRGDGEWAGECARAVGMPGALISPLGLFLQPTVAAGMTAVTMLTGSGGDVLLGVVGLLALTLPACAMAWRTTVRHECVAVLQTRRWKGLGDDDDAAGAAAALGSRVKVAAHRIATLLTAPYVEWVGRGRSALLELAHFGKVFEGYRGAREWFVWVELCTAVTFGALSGVHPATDSGCTTQLWINLALSVAVLATSFAWAYNGLLWNVNYSVNAVLMVLVALMLLYSDDSTSTVLALVTVWLTISMALSDILCRGFTLGWWRKARDWLAVHWEGSPEVKSSKTRREDSGSVPKGGSANAKSMLLTSMNVRVLAKQTPQEALYVLIRCICGEHTSAVKRD